MTRTFNYGSRESEVGSGYSSAAVGTLELYPNVDGYSNDGDDGLKRETGG